MIISGDCLEIIKTFESNSIDSLVTDPPAGISFMGKAWDSDKGGRDAWIAWMTEVMAECLRVLKPGAHALVWAIPRTSHWTTTALENAGFEIRDVVTHLFGTGFPKSLDVSKAIDKAAGAERMAIAQNPNACKSQESYSLDGESGNFKAIYGPITEPTTDAAKQWQGWGTALKPACEFWVLCRKPLSEKTVAANVLKWGTGALNIDASRIAGQVPKPVHGVSSRQGEIYGKYRDEPQLSEPHVAGRFPANLVLDDEAAAALDEQSGFSQSPGKVTRGGKRQQAFGMSEQRDVSCPSDSGGASRFFYVAKASKSDKGADNSHPTVKSTALMSYLIKLITPPDGLVLDPFMGSGSTGVAAKREGFEFVGVEQEQTYFEIAKQRLAE